jgi:outer membrane receptor for ferrienterochelin and colicins
MKSIFITFLIFISIQTSRAQEIKQVFVGEIIENDTIPIIGATMIWLNSTIGATTNEKGIAELECIGKYPNKLVLNYLGYKTDTVVITEDIPFFSLFMQSDNQLEEFVVESTLPSNFIEFLNPIKTEVIDASEFRKAACCNLSESFQTNATVDVGYNDAVTGSKEIMMLGLDGNYVQILTENQPLFRGLVQSFGLEFIPAAWMNKIAVSKGISSVKNGYEGLTGAVNIENKQPFEAEKFGVDLFFNHQGRTELFLSAGQKINKKLANVIFFGGSLNRAKWDGNGDGFLDNPLTTLVNFMDRINFQNKKSEGQFAIKYAFEDRIGGQVKFDNKTDKGTTNAYGFGAKTNRLELAAKNGYFLSGNEFQSLGIQVSGVYHNMDAFYGLHKYIGKEYNGNLNLIYQNIIKNTNHKIEVGSSFMIDDLSEQLDSIVLKRTEIVPGIFGEYTYAFLEKITLLAGIRLDYHNQYGIQFTPRVHFRYSPTENTAIRINAGRGWRVSNPIAENISLLVSSRNLNILESLDKESGWNYGISFLQSFEIRKITGSFALDFFRNRFY